MYRIVSKERPTNLHCSIWHCLEGDGHTFEDYQFASIVRPLPTHQSLLTPHYSSPVPRCILFILRLHNCTSGPKASTGIDNVCDSTQTSNTVCINRRSPKVRPPPVFSQSSCRGLFASVERPVKIKVRGQSLNTEHAQKLRVPHDKLTVSYVVRCGKDVLCNCRSCLVSDSRLRASNLEVWASTFQGGKTILFFCESVGLFHR